MVRVPATMTVAVALDLLARHGSLATAEHAAGGGDDDDRAGHQPVRRAKHLVQDEVVAALPHLRWTPSASTAFSHPPDAAICECTPSSTRTPAAHCACWPTANCSSPSAPSSWSPLLVSLGRSSSDPRGLTPSEAVAYAGLFAGTVLLVRVVAAVIRDSTT